MSSGQSQSRVRVNYEWIWEKITRYLKSRWQSLNPTWHNSRWLSSSSWVRMNEWSFFVQMVGTNLGKCEWVWMEILWCLNPRWLNSRWQNSRWLSSSQLKSEWMSLSQIELVWVSIRVEWECFGGNVREDNKVSESKMAVSESNIAQFRDGCHHQLWVRMNEWSFFVQMVGTNIGKCEWVWKEILWWLKSKMARIQDGRIQDSWHHQH